MNKLLCYNCKVEFTRKRKPKATERYFCSRPCSASFNNSENPKRIKTKTCKGCSEKILSNKTYCTISCMQEFFARENSFRAKSKSKRNSKAVVSFRQRIKLKAIEYKGGKCSICGYCRCARALEFHHIDPETKDFAISAKSVSWETIVKELDKCILVCSNCHAEIHSGFIN